MASVMGSRLDVTGRHSTSARAGKKLKCTIEQCGGRCLRAGEVCRLVPTKEQAKMWGAAAGEAKKSKRSKKTELLSAIPAKKQTSPAETLSPKSEKEESIAPIRKDELSRIRKEIIDLVGEDLVLAAEKNIQKIIDESDTFIRVPSTETIESIISSGRYISSVERFEKNKPDYLKGLTLNEILNDPDVDVEDYTAADYTNRRIQQEELMFGIPENSKPSDRPIYGYSGVADFSSPHQAPLSNYGNVAVKLKKQAKSRTTILTDDSWGGGLPSASNEFNAASAISSRYLRNKDVNEIKKQLKNLAESKDLNDFVKKFESPYIENQIHGGVKTDDIEEIHFLKGQVPSQKIIEWAKKNNVKLTKVD